MELQPAIQSYRHSSLPVSAQRTVNLYAEAHVRGAKEPVTMLGFPGVETFATCGTGPIRGFIKMGGVGYVVSRDEFYSFDSDGNETLLGTGITGLNPVSMAGNGSQIVIVNGTTAGWTYTVSGSSFAQISDGDFQGGATVTFLDGYFIFDWLGTNKFYLSDLLDGASYTSTLFASAESNPDDVISIINNHGVLLVFGETTIEPWNHTGALNFPFQRYDGSIPQRGIAAAQARVLEDNSIFFLGEDRVFYRLTGITPQRLSTHALEHEWQAYGDISDTFCFSVPWNGHKFIYLTFPLQSKTFGFDPATNLWHERISWDVSGAEVKWRANCSLSIYNKVLIGDANSGKIGYLTDSTYTEFGDPIVGILTLPSINNRGLRGFMPKFQVDMETGVGTTTGQGSDPQIMMDYSDNGGRTFGTPELWKSMGALGDYGVRLEWDRLGHFYQRVMRLRVSDPVKRSAIMARAPGLYWEAE